MDDRETRTINGVEYERWAPDKIWRPVGSPTELCKDPYICACMTAKFIITYPQPFQTDATCACCGHTETIHSG